MEKQLIVRYREYESAEQMEKVDSELVCKALEATNLSYAPYSKFNVGAAVRMSDGRIFTGANQENAAFPSGLCAERTALFYAHAHADGAYIESIAIAASQGGVQVKQPITPCGSCRQVMAEFCTSDNPVSVLLAGSAKSIKFDNALDLLPFTFDSF
ncbi:MAG: cytidine deaminase [Bacteroidaceae bacterium]|nr:cytidine deaminase [Bacteroidaceae bacterium]